MAIGETVDKVVELPITLNSNNQICDTAEFLYEIEDGYSTSKLSIDKDSGTLTLKPGSSYFEFKIEVVSKG